jgi:hypothetical protein
MRSDDTRKKKEITSQHTVKSAVKIFILSLLTVLSALVSPSAGVISKKAPVLLTVYIYDQCGGCGVDGPGCGECKESVKCHGIIKEQFGGRLYDGTIEYRLLNCRINAHEAARAARGEIYGVPDGLRHIRPVTYIGDENGGLYLPGEALLPYAAEMLDRYINGAELNETQNEILEIYENANKYN